MTFRTYKAFITSLSVLALVIATDETFGASAAGVTAQGAYEPRAPIRSPRDGCTTIEEITP